MPRLLRVQSVGALPPTLQGGYILHKVLGMYRARYNIEEPPLSHNVNMGGLFC